MNTTLKAFMYSTAALGVIALAALFSMAMGALMEYVMQTWGKVAVVILMVLTIWLTFTLVIWGALSDYEGDGY